MAWLPLQTVEVFNCPSQIPNTASRGWICFKLPHGFHWQLHKHQISDPEREVINQFKVLLILIILNPKTYHYNDGSPKHNQYKADNHLNPYPYDTQRRSFNNNNIIRIKQYQQGPHNPTFQGTSQQNHSPTCRHDNLMKELQSGTEASNPNAFKTACQNLIEKWTEHISESEEFHKRIVGNTTEQIARWEEMLRLKKLRVLEEKLRVLVENRRK